MHHGAFSLLSAVTKHLSFVLYYSVVAANFTLDCAGFQWQNREMSHWGKVKSQHKSKESLAPFVFTRN